MEYNENDPPELVAWKMKHEMAILSHSRHSEDGRAVFSSALDMALEAIRTATAINGGQ